MPPIYFVRHGETDWNRQGIIQGWTDIELNETGHAQANSVARAFVAHAHVTRDCRFAVSPMIRTRQTMGHIEGALSLSPHHVAISPDVKELGFGEWEGKPFWELKASPFYPADHETRFNWRPRGGESYADGQARIAQWLQRVDEPTVVVAHGAIGRCLIGHLCNLPVEELMSIRMPQGRFCQIENGQAEWFDGSPIAP